MSDPSAPERISTGIEKLDNILGGGLPPRRMYLLQGDPGVGKTTLALQYLMTGRSQGERTLYVTLSESAEELAAVAASHGWSLDGLDIYDMSAADAERFEQEAENTLYVPAEVELGERVNALLAEVERVQPRRVVIDSISELRLLAQGPLRFRRQILALKADLVRRQCTVFLLDNPTTPTGDVLLQSLVHGVVHLQQLSPEYGAERRRLRVIKLREVKFRGGYHDYIVDRGGLQVFPRLVAAEHHVDFEAETVSTGIPEMDTLLGGGLSRGTSTLILGPSGSGKSSLAARIALAAGERGERAVLYLFDEGAGTLVARCRALGMPLEGQVESGNILVQQIDPAAMPPGQFVHQVRDAVEHDGVKIVVIDSLNGFLSGMPEERFLVIQLHELLSYMRQRGVVVLLVEAQHGVVGAGRAGPVDVSYLSDTVVLFRYFEAAGRVRKAVSVLKQRTSAHENTIRELTIGADGVVVGPALEAFKGVLSGSPTYRGETGESGPLLDQPQDD